MTYRNWIKDESVTYTNQEALRIASDHKNQDEAKNSLESSEDMALLTPWFWIWMLQNYERINFYYFKSSNLLLLQ